MKLDMDLVRKILLWLESDPTIKKSNAEEVALGTAFEEKMVEIKLSFDGQGCNFLDGSEFDGESKDKVLYHYRKLLEADFVNGQDEADFVNILDISFTGHQFLDEIRDDEVWRRTKEGAMKIGSFSIETLRDVAKAIVKKMIKDWTDGELEI
ncbi:MAG: DUF2513 domain-containing protein [Hyphomicrobiaceae bacterium]|nr:DUF2513 domain-containing protein [Hyphomicrobiaceae bacterium]